MALLARSQAELDKAHSREQAATAQVNSAQAVLDNSKLNRGWTTVTSPISGIAGIAKVGIGDLMTPTTVIHGMPRILRVPSAGPEATICGRVHGSTAAAADTQMNATPSTAIRLSRYAPRFW